MSCVEWSTQKKMPGALLLRAETQRLCRPSKSCPFSDIDATKNLQNTQQNIIYSGRVTTATCTFEAQEGASSSGGNVLKYMKKETTRRKQESFQLRQAVSKNSQKIHNTSFSSFNQGYKSPALKKRAALNGANEAESRRSNRPWPLSSPPPATLR